MNNTKKILASALIMSTLLPGAAFAGTKSIDTNSCSPVKPNYHNYHKDYNNHKKENTVHKKDSINLDKEYTNYDKDYGDFKKTIDKDKFLNLVENFSKETLALWVNVIDERTDLLDQIADLQNSDSYLKKLEAKKKALEDVVNTGALTKDELKDVLEKRVDKTQEKLEKINEQDDKNEQALRSAIKNEDKKEIRDALDQILEDFQDRNDVFQSELTEMKK